MAVPTFLDATSNNGNQVASINVTYPTSSSGDLLVMGVQIVRMNSTSSFSATTPSGWTVIDTDFTSATSGTPNAGSRLSLYWLFRGAETSVTVASPGSTNYFSAADIFAYSASTVDALAPIGSGSDILAESSSSTTLDTPSVVTNRNDCALALFAGATRLGSSTAPNWTWTGPTEQEEGGGGGVINFSWQGYARFGGAASTQVAAGSTGGRTCASDAAVFNRLRGVVIVQPPLLVGSNIYPQSIQRASLY